MYKGFEEYQRVQTLICKLDHNFVKYDNLLLCVRQAEQDNVRHEFLGRLILHRMA